jgi:hypothetical protein
MSQIVSELNLIYTRLWVLTSNRKWLAKNFESLSEEFSADLSPRHNRSLVVSARLPGDGVGCLTAFTLGRRSSMFVRVALLGLSLDSKGFEAGWLGSGDALIFCVDGSDPEFDRLLSLQLSRETKSLPAVLLWAVPPAKIDLRLKGLRLWFERNFKNLRVVDRDNRGHALREGLDWALSFS